MIKKSSILETAIVYFKNMTIDYSANDDMGNALYIFYLRTLSQEEFR